ncbi:MAG: DciA family protein [Azospirillaceae bacterium]|nr:DciA family protein [Azospirillaceae bacterium]
MPGPRPIGRHLNAIAGKALGPNGPAFATLLAEWEAIVGPRLAQVALPLKLQFPKGRQDDAVLHLGVQGPAALFIQHEEPQILQRLNGFFGFRAVVRLKLVQAPPATNRRRDRPAPVPRRLSPAEAAGLEAQTGAVENTDLRDALASLGRAILATEKPAPANPKR